MKHWHDRFGYIWNVKVRQIPFLYRIHKKKPLSKKPIQIVGIMRERNEELLLQDSLDHLSQFVDAIVVFDDASSDRSVEIARSHPAVVEVIENKRWRKENRVWEETSNRQKIFNRAKKYNPQWFFYCDADERFEGDIRNYLLNECPQDIDAIRISLFDAYMTPDDKEPYVRGHRLLDFRKYFGPERRNIIMIWRNKKNVVFNVRDAREPQRISGKQEIKFYCQHYGKSLSVEHWEETCDYYINYFPKYSEKWRQRKGKAVHVRSDFDRELYTWDDVKNRAVDI